MLNFVSTHGFLTTHVKPRLEQYLSDDDIFQLFDDKEDLSKLASPWIEAIDRLTSEGTFKKKGKVRRIIKDNVTGIVKKKKELVKFPDQSDIKSSVKKSQDQDDWKIKYLSRNFGPMTLYTVCDILFNHLLCLFLIF